jgi:hypothetical protein
MFFLASAALLMVLTPGPNMIYLISRSIRQSKLEAAMSASESQICSRKTLAAGSWLHRCDG